MKKNYFIKVIIASTIQILFSLYVIYAVLFSRTYKGNLFVAFVVILFCIHFFNSGVQLLKYENYARILSISNMLILAIISVGGLLWVGIDNWFRFSSWAVMLLISIYFVYFLTRREVKEQVTKDSRRD